MKKTYDGDLRTIDFLSNFQPDSRTQIIEFGKKISSSELEADVYLVMARKAICFVDMLLKFNLAKLNGIIVTDRILDTDIQWLNGKSITIIDDALVSGTTIRKTIDKLLSVVDQDKIKVHVLSVNSEWYKRTETDLSKKYPYEMLVRTDGKGKVLFDSFGNPMSFLTKPLNYQTNEKCMRTCFNIVKALSTTPKPYDIDFPLYEDIKINKNQLDILFNSNWTPINIIPITQSTTFQIKPESYIESTCNSISFFPPNEIEKLILSIFKLSSKSCSFKMRSYIRERKKDKSALHISFLPITIINEISNNDIDRIFKIICNCCKNESKKMKDAFCSYSSKFRLIQFLISTVVSYAFFISNTLYDISPKTGQPVFPKYLENRVCYIFPSDLCSIIKIISLELCKKYASLKIEHKNNFALNNYIGPNLSINPLGVFENLINNFLDLYNDKELLARKLSKKYGHKVFEIKEYKEIVNRLDVGKTFNDLLNTSISIYNSNRNYNNGIKNTSVVPIKRIPNANLLVSVFLDYAIDAGIAVPIIYIKSKSISRAYRHGEDVIFADEEARLLSYMLYVFSTNISPDYIMGGLLVEKLFSSFIRLGLRYKIFNKYDYSQICSQHNEYLKITYNLHGSTVRLYDERTTNYEPKFYVTYDDASQWLWNVLADKGLIIANKKSHKIDNSEHSITFTNECIEKFKDLENTSKGIDSERIAETIGYCFNENILSIEDLTLINATNGYSEIIPALLAEIEIILNSAFTKTNIFENAFNNKYAMNVFQKNRNRRFFIAMNSGTWKFEKFQSNYAYTRIYEIKDTLSKMKEREKYRNWVQMWEEQLSNVENEQPEEITAILFQIANSIYQYGLIYRLLEYLAFCKTLGVESIKNYFIEIREELSKHIRDDYKKVIKDYNYKYSNIYAYFKVSNIKSKINYKNIMDDDFIEDVSKAKFIKIEIFEYINNLTKINQIKPFCQSATLLTVANEIINTYNFEEKNLSFLISQIQKLGKDSKLLQNRASKYINSYGKIEKPIEYENVAYIRYNSSESCYLRKDILSKIKSRQKRIKRKGIDLAFSELDNGVIVFASGDKTDAALYRLANQIYDDLNFNKELGVYVFLNIEPYYRPYRFSKQNNSDLSIVSPFHCKKMLSSICSSLYKKNYLLSYIYPNDYSLSKEFNNDSGTITKIKYKENILQVKTVYTKDTMPKLRKGFTICVICAKITELKGVQKHILEEFKTTFEDCLDEQENYRRILKTEVAMNGICHQIILTLSDQGNTGASIAYDSLAHFKPDYVFFCGIAGSCNKDIEIGDVFIPFTIIDVTLKKSLNDKLQVRGDAYKIQAHHKGLLQIFTSEFSDNSAFSVYNDNALSDNTVIACEDSEYLRGILAVNDKSAACIEMESAGIYNADYSRNKTKYGVYTVRGISDKANAKKDDTQHKLAINNASKTLSKLIRFLIEKYDIINKIK